MERFDSSGSGFNSSGSGSSNSFAGPSVAVIRDIPIAEHVPVKLSTTAANFSPWKTYFGLLFREYDLLDHVDGTIDLLAMPHDPEWLAIDATIIRWFYQTVSNDIFRTVVRDGDSAHTEFFGTHQNDLSLDEYALKLKSLSDELRDLEFPIDDKIMLSTLSAGLSEDLSNTASNLTLLTTPTFEQALAPAPPQASPGSGSPHRLHRRLLPWCPDSRALASSMGQPRVSPAGQPPGQTGPWTGQSGHRAAGRPGGTRAEPTTGPRTGQLRAVAAAAVVAVAVATVATVAPMPQPPRLVPRSTPPLRHGLPVTTHPSWPFAGASVLGRPAQYQRIAGLHQLGFRSTRSDASLFIYRTGNDMAYLLLYVDDIILTASTAGLLRQLTDSLRAEFALKDLGPLHYFLGIEVVRRADGFFLH
ncbi:hypothetical protein QYE76_009774 [Lolium multiflorum]|uniref:Reverse transcriptase Ty1/copia-type domain-containing protein n=1 Tax=Lolium multiflorum TaxID=4521 RepID=A0AAD8X3Q6_LOLMU|nr:hypothetical protein QYE76_009774 [Lolium multiflorum]